MATFVQFPSHHRKLPPLNLIIPTWSHIHPLTFSIYTHTHTTHRSENDPICNTQIDEYARLEVINQQAGCQFRLDVTFKVLFSLYIQYTSQKYTVNLQRRSVTYIVKSAVRNDRFSDHGYKCERVSACSPLFICSVHVFYIWRCHR